MCYKENKAYRAPHEFEIICRVLYAFRTLIIGPRGWRRSQSVMGYKNEGIERQNGRPGLPNPYRMFEDPIVNLGLRHRYLQHSVPQAECSCLKFRGII